MGTVTNRSAQVSRFETPFAAQGGSSVAAMDLSTQDLFLCGSLAGWTDPDLNILAEMGWSTTKLATLKGCEEKILDCILVSARKKKETFGQDTSGLRDLVTQCDNRSANIHRADAGRGSQDLLEAHLEHQRQKRRKVLEGLEGQEIAERIKMVGQAKIFKWPTRLGKKLHLAGSDLALREQAERSERERWLGELRVLMKKATHRSSEDSLMMRIAKGRRPNTLRKHVKTWHKVGQWLEATFGKPWPSTPSEFADYLEAIVQEPCAKSAPEAAYKTLMFMEFAGEVNETEFIHKSSAVRNALEEAQVRLASVELKPARQALMLPLAIVIAMEAIVMDDDRLPFPRAYAWFRLVKLWAGLRFDDTKGTPNRSIELRENHLVGIIHKSKTSGPGKRILLLPFYVSKEAWVSHPKWLEVGRKIWNHMSMEAGLLTRDFMLPWPTLNKTGFARRMADYSTASAMSQALFGELWVMDQGQRASLLFAGVGALWTEHSERATLRSWASASRIPPDIRRQMGRWRPAVDEGYERTTRANILRAQRVIASFLRDNQGRGDPMDEGAVLEAVSIKMGLLGYPDEAMEVQARLLETFQPEELAFEPSWRPKWTPTGPVVLVEPEEDDDVKDMVNDTGDGGFESEGEEMQMQPAEIVRAEQIAGTYVVSIVGRSRTRTLHRVGECHRQPGVHYSQFEILGDEPPDASEYHRACKNCFGKDGALAGGSPEEDESSGEVTSSDSMESEAEPSA